MIEEILDLIQSMWNSYEEIETSSLAQRAEALRLLESLGVDIHHGQDRTGYLEPPYAGGEFPHIRFEKIGLTGKRFGVSCRRSCKNPVPYTKFLNQVSSFIDPVEAPDQSMFDEMFSGPEQT